MNVQAAGRRGQIRLGADAERQSSDGPVVRQAGEGYSRSISATPGRGLRDDADACAFAGHPADALEGSQLDADLQPGADPGGLRLQVISQSAFRQADERLIEEAPEPHRVFPAVPYLQALGLSKDDLVQALGPSFTVSTIAPAIGLGARDAFRLENLILSALAVPPSLAGMWAGQVIRGRITPSLFRRLFLVGLLLLGIEMLGRALS